MTGEQAAPAAPSKRRALFWRLNVALVWGMGLATLAMLAAYWAYSGVVSHTGLWLFLLILGSGLLIAHLRR